MGFSRFPRKKINWIVVQTPQACIHLEKFMYPLALVSGAPHKAYIFRFNTPTNNTFPASGTHTCLILRGYPPSSHTFLAKSQGVNPPLCSYIIRNVGSTPYSWTSWGRGLHHSLVTIHLATFNIQPFIIHHSSFIIHHPSSSFMTHHPSSIIHHPSIITIIIIIIIAAVVIIITISITISMTVSITISLCFITHHSSVIILPSSFVIIHHYVYFCVIFFCLLSGYVLV